MNQFALRPSLQCESKNPPPGFSPNGWEFLVQILLLLHVPFYAIVVPFELYELYDWGKVPELYGTIRILHFALFDVKFIL